ATSRFTTATQVGMRSPPHGNKLTVDATTNTPAANKYGTGSRMTPSEWIATTTWYPTTAAASDTITQRGTLTTQHRPAEQTTRATRSCPHQAGNQPPRHRPPPPPAQSPI